MGRCARIAAEFAARGGRSGRRETGSQISLLLHVPVLVTYNLRIVSKAALLKFANEEPEALEPLLRWFRIAKAARWISLADTKLDFPHADYVAPLTVFNVGGNKYRLIVAVSYKWQIVYIRHVLTHTAYDTGGWKQS